MSQSRPRWPWVESRAWSFRRESVASGLGNVDRETGANGPAVPLVVVVGTPEGVAPDVGGGAGLGSGDGSVIVEPEMAILVSPASVVSPTDWLNSPRMEDLKLRCTLTASPVLILAPTVGRPVASNGVAGVCTALTVSGVPVSVNVTS